MTQEAAPTTKLRAPPKQVTPAPAPAPQVASAARAVKFGGIDDGKGRRVVLYGPGGIGKTTLAACAPGPVAFFDLDDSLPRLKGQLAECPHEIDIRTVQIAKWQELRDALNSPGWDEVSTIVVDTLTRAEEMCAEHTLANVKNDKGNRVTSIEEYGWGKGYTHVYDTFLPLLSDLDRHASAGRNVVLVCHDCTNTVPNPSGEDWIRYEPRLQSPNSGKASIRLRVREWADDLLFVGYDISVTDGVGKARGTRTIYPTEQPSCMAKSRSMSKSLALPLYDATLWNTLFES